MRTGGLKMIVFVGLVLLAVFVLAGGVGQWLLFGLFLWGMFAIMGPGRSRHRGRQRMRAAQPALPRQPRGRIDRVTAGRLPVEIQVKAEQIQRKAEGLLEYADRFPTGSHDLYVVQKTVAEYLPNTLEAYVALPPGYAGVVLADGRTALQSLWDQLNLLERKLDEIGYDFHKQNLERLVANGRFLEERFGNRKSELDAAVIR
jgi:hypothetical protein